MSCPNHLTPMHRNACPTCNPKAKGSWVTPEKFAARVIEEVCELSDYTSPDDQPDLLQCTVQQLEACVLRTFEYFGDNSEAEQ